MAEPEEPVIGGCVGHQPGGGGGNGRRPGYPLSRSAQVIQITPSGPTPASALSAEPAI